MSEENAHAKLRRGMRFVFGTAALAALICVVPSARAENPWEELMGRKPRLWSDPQGRFTIDLPIGWSADEKQSANGMIGFWRQHPDYGHSAHVTVEIKNLPPGVKLAHFGVRVAEDVQKVAKNYNPIEEDRIDLGGMPAIRRYFTYQEKAHAQLTNEVVQIIAVSGERGYIITLETGYGVRQIFWEDFNLMLRGFSAGAEMRIDRKPGEGRKRLKAGEMVNPNGVPY